MAEEIVIPSFYEFLKSRKPASDLSDQEIDALRKEYNRYRNRLYKKRQREQNIEVTVFLSREEHRILKDAAQKHKLQLVHYLKQAALKYTDSTFIVPDAKALASLVSELESIQKVIRGIAERKRGFLSRDTSYEEVLQVVSDMRYKLIESLTKPVNVERWVLDHLEHDEAFKRKLLTLLLSHV